MHGYSRNKTTTVSDTVRVGGQRSVRVREGKKFGAHVVRHDARSQFHLQFQKSGTLLGLGTPEQENTGYFKVITHEIRLLEIETKCYF